MTSGENISATLSGIYDFYISNGHHILQLRPLMMTGSAVINKGRKTKGLNVSLTTVKRLIFFPTIHTDGIF